MPGRTTSQCKTLSNRAHNSEKMKNGNIWKHTSQMQTLWTYLYVSNMCIQGYHWWASAPICCPPPEAAGPSASSGQGLSFFAGTPPALSRGFQISQLHSTIWINYESIKIDQIDRTCWEHAGNYRLNHTQSLQATTVLSSVMRHVARTLKNHP